MTEVDMNQSEIPSQSYHVSILETVKSAQMQNGLRHGDYQRYRMYCARRLRRIRKSTKFTNGRGKQFVNKKVTPEIVSDERLLSIPLYNAERAWSYAMQLREDEKIEKEEKGIDASTRIKFHLIKRLTKSAYWSQQLLDICLVVADARTCLEAEAYSSYMTGNLLLYREDWHEALTKFLTSQRILTELSRVGTLEQRDVLQAMLDEIDPYIRYCEYNVELLQDSTSVSSASILELKEHGSALLQSKLDEVLIVAAKKQAETIQEISWRNQSIPVRSEELRLAILQIEEKCKKLDQLNDINDDDKREACFLEIFRVLDLALRSVHNEQEQFEKMKSGQLVDAQRDELRKLEAYIRWMKLRQLLERNLILLLQLQKKQKANLSSQTDDGLLKQLYRRASSNSTTSTTTAEPEEMIHLCNMLLQNVNELQSISDTSADQSERAEYECRKSYFTSLRCYYLADIYVNNTKFAEADVLYENASSSLYRAEESLNERISMDSNFSRDKSLIESLRSSLDGAKSRTRALGFLKSSESSGNLKEKMANLSVSSTILKKQRISLVQRQEYFESGESSTHRDIISIPPSMEAVACKPMLFDVAYNELSFPELRNRMMTAEEKAQLEQAEGRSGSGFFGWLRG